MFLRLKSSSSSLEVLRTGPARCMGHTVCQDKPKEKESKSSTSHLPGFGSRSLSSPYISLVVRSDAELPAPPNVRLCALSVRLCALSVRLCALSVCGAVCTVCL